MKKLTILPIVLAGAFALSACSGQNVNISQNTESSGQADTAADTTAESTSQNDNASEEATQTGSTSEAAEQTWDGTYNSMNPATAVIVSASDAEDQKESISGDFKIEAEEPDGYSQSGQTITITKGGEYTLSGALDGNIVIDAGDDDEVELVLDGTSITCSDAAPIYVVNADSVKITAKDGSYNEIIDERSERTDDEEEVTDASNASAAIYSTCDLTIKGQGALVVEGGYNNGIHTKDDLEVKNLTLKVTAANNGLKGNDSVTVESGEIIVIAEGGDGIKTKNSDVSSKGNQKGIVDIQGGTIDIYTQFDGIDAAYDVYVADGVNLNIYTGTYDTKSDSKSAKADAADADGSESANADAAAMSYELDFGGFGGFGFGRDGSDKDNENTESQKGIKSDNAVVINGGNINISSTDDSIHGNAGTELENGESGVGTVTINGGTLTLETADDGIHADTDLTVNNGYINITTCYEGLEGHQITVNGGCTWVYATDDAFNASTAYINNGAMININGGYVDVTTPSGDTDAVDSNGSYEQTGGYVVVKGGSSMGQNAGSVDVDGSISVTGGAIVAVGGICETPENSCNAYVASGQSMASGDYELVDADGEEILTFSLSDSYSSFWVCSELLETGTEYNLNLGGSAVLNWTQEDGTMGGSSSGGLFGNLFGGGSGGHGGGNMGGGHGNNDGSVDPNQSGSASVDPGQSGNSAADPGQNGGTAVNPGQNGGQSAPGKPDSSEMPNDMPSGGDVPDMSNGSSGDTV